jgi:hypothetical protein
VSVALSAAFSALTLLFAFFANLGIESLERSVLAFALKDSLSITLLKPAVPVLMTVYYVSKRVYALHAVQQQILENLTPLQVDASQSSGTLRVVPQSAAHAERVAEPAVTIFPA